jgi:hypothetical protein
VALRKIIWSHNPNPNSHRNKEKKLAVPYRFLNKIVRNHKTPSNGFKFYEPISFCNQFWIVADRSYTNLEIKNSHLSANNSSSSSSSSATTLLAVTSAELWDMFRLKRLKTNDTLAVNNINGTSLLICHKNVSISYRQSRAHLFQN